MVRDVCHGDQVATRAIVMQHKTQRPAQFEITSATRNVRVLPLVGTYLRIASF